MKYILYRRCVTLLMCPVSVFIRKLNSHLIPLFVRLLARAFLKFTENGHLFTTL